MYLPPRTAPPWIPARAGAAVDPQSPSSSWTPQPPPPRGGRGKAAVVDPRRVDPRHGEGGRKTAAMVRPDPSGTPWWMPPPPCCGGPCRREMQAAPPLEAARRLEGRGHPAAARGGVRRGSGLAPPPCTAVEPRHDRLLAFPPSWICAVGASPADEGGREEEREGAPEL
ncbi:uncharacterized protein [Miscanthus floridulus]|uniref:uncharacterized protein n=1 Tax=Miscanthus floridulus TaxID=154761 RepID=UPI0034574B75